MSFCRPSGTWFLFYELTPDLRPGLRYAAPFGLGRRDPFCVFSHGPRGPGAEARSEMWALYAALKRRSSTSLWAAEGVPQRLEPVGACLRYGAAEAAPFESPFSKHPCKTGAGDDVVWCFCA
jgi:hypothetical protein